MPGGSSNVVLRCMRKSETIECGVLSYALCVVDFFSDHQAFLNELPTRLLDEHVCVTIWPEKIESF